MKAQTTLITCAIVLGLSLLALAPHWKARAIGAAAVAQGGSQTDFPPPSVTICGPVTEYQPATAGSTGVLVIGTIRLTIAAGASLSGFSVGANVCATFCFNPAGQIVSTDGPATANASGEIKICGVVTEYVVDMFIKIGPVRLRMIFGARIQGLPLVSPGANICLTPKFDGSGNLMDGSSVAEAPNTLQIRIQSLVHGFVDDNKDDIFRLPESPVILSVQQPIPAGVTVTPLNDLFPTIYPGLRPQDVFVFSNSTPNSTVRATSCGESIWDVLFQIGTTGATDGDMVTFSLQKPDGSGQIILAMFTIQGNGAVLTQLASDVRFLIGGGRSFPIGTFIPFHTAANGELRSDLLVLVFDMGSARLKDCLQYVAEIKRAGGDGKTSIIHGEVVVKRMEGGNDREAGQGIGLLTGSPGWHPTVMPCAVVCQACLPPPPQQPLPGSLSGFVYCDSNANGIKEAGEPAISGVTITLTGVDINGNVNQTTTTDATGFYLFKDLMPGVFKLTETQPANTFDGLDTLGSLGGDPSNDMFANIPLPSLGKGTDYNFGEICPVSTPTPTPTPTVTPTPTPTVTPTPTMPLKCDTICWRSTQSLLNNSRFWPGGTVLAAGFNANNPIGVQTSINTIRIILQGGMSAQQRLNREFVTAQLSMNLSGGSGSPVVFNAFWSPLRCSQVTFGSVSLSNGLTFTPESLLDTLMNQTIQAIRDNRSQDYDELANLWALLNGKCGVF